MYKFYSVVILSFVLCVSANADSSSDGSQVFENYCSMCHLPLAPGQPSIGPSLKGIVGRSIGSLPGFNYTAALSSWKGNWSEENLNQFLLDPMNKAPGTAMAFGGISDEQDRKALIGYLKTFK
jgi:cytochrome c